MALTTEIYPRVMHALSLLSQGYTLTRACDTAGISAGTLQKHVANVPELQEAYGEAEQRGYDTLADILLEIHVHPYYGTTSDAKAKLISDNIKWYLARKRPSQYGDRTIVETHITADKAIVEALARGRERAENGTIEDATYKVIENKVSEQLVPDELKPFL